LLSFLGISSSHIRTSASKYEDEMSLHQRDPFAVLAVSLLLQLVFIKSHDNVTLEGLTAVLLRIAIQTVLHGG
jgi:hypothetical protein